MNQEEIKKILPHRDNMLLVEEAESGCTLTKSRGAFYVIDAKGYVDGKLCVSAELSFALVENK